ncbi:uncharacterized protein LOC126654012 [Mercurialis annua]|uniref:uncharacterized protein LOC126654012 n=1 Tax=Mercurialis annua TaxID=3986 RepID=UPI00215E8227|nr:uncharacterized protein LOC126654012 [Mercurialis annua]XP_050204001.1 uncharacterized protein LOC126654012 [Mercurialis annua]XP_050204003.1 uncharacterized protein LOC126654012 [Mercurialis annua]
MDKLYTTGKHIIWIVKFEFMEYVDTLETAFCSGFSIDGTGLVMTCAQPFQKCQGKPSLVISARRLDENGIFHEAELVYQKPQWDVMLLKVKGISDTTFGKLVDDGSLYAGQPVFMISAAGELVASFLRGMVAFPCYHNADLPPDDGTTCADIVPNSWDSITKHRVMGDLCSLDGYRGLPIHPLLPIIQINSSIHAGSSHGCPIFNLMGEIVGMIIGLSDVVIGIHVSALRQVVQELEEKKNVISSATDPKP